MSQREPFEWIEIDVDYCDLTYGEGDCTASLGATGVRKCFNMFRHCQDQENFTKGVKTLKYCKPASNLPVNAGFYPVLQSVRMSTATVNIGGIDKDLSALGRRGTMEARLLDFADHGRGLDKYQAERISGAAQTDEGGYDPVGRGSHFTKLMAQFPYYSGRPARQCSGYIEDGAVITVETRHFVMTNISTDRSGRYTIESKDILDLADNKKAVAPAATSGVVLDPITAESGVVTMQPEGIGDLEYPASGVASIGSELVEFTRIADVLTLTQRGAKGTQASSHDTDDAVQLAYSVFKQRLDVTIRELLVDYAGIDEAFIPFDEWQAEVTRWAGTLLLSVTIPKPEGVAGLVGELATLGVSIWWDDVSQKIRLKMVRPIDGDTLFELSDDSGIKQVSRDDMEDDRITEVGFYSVTVNPMDSYKRPENYKRQFFPVDILSKSPNAHGDTRKLDVFMRWLDHGNDRLAKIVSRRILKRRRTSPVRYTMLLDDKDGAIGLTDVLSVTTRAYTDETGKKVPALMQVLSREKVRNGHEFRVVAQSYVYEGRFGYAMPAGSPSYGDATEEQRATGCFAVDAATLKFPDNTNPYEAI